jgi:hypothetical protein
MRKNKNCRSHYGSRKKTNLDEGLYTSSTLTGLPTGGDDQNRGKEVKVSVRPKFKDPQGNNSNLLNSCYQILKIIGVLIPIATFIGGIVWYASTLATNVDTLKSDVSEIKTTNKNLTEKTITHSNKLENIQNEVTKIERKLEMNRSAQNEKVLEKEN